MHLCCPRSLGVGGIHLVGGDVGIRYRRGKSYGQIVDDMCVIKDEAEAKQYFEDAVQQAMEGPLNREAAVERVRGNLGYLMGYAPTEIDCAMWERVGASHPIFGSMADGVQLIPEEILKKGAEIGEKVGR